MMAEATDVAQVQDLLPADEADFDTVKISQYLDSGMKVSQVLRHYWESRSSKLYTAMDISESGSSRALSRLYDNAKSQLDYWSDRVATERSIAQEESSRIAFHKLKRV